MSFSRVFLLTLVTLQGVAVPTFAASVNTRAIPSFSTSLGFTCNPIEKRSTQNIGCLVGEAQLSLDMFDTGKLP
jgi:hypothetical protein